MRRAAAVIGLVALVGPVAACSSGDDDGSTSDEQNLVVTEAVFEATLTVTCGDESNSATHTVDIVSC